MAVCSCGFGVSDPATSYGAAPSAALIMATTAVNKLALLLFITIACILTSARNQPRLDFHIDHPANASSCSCFENPLPEERVAETVSVGSFMYEVVSFQSFKRLAHCTGVRHSNALEEAGSEDADLGLFGKPL